MSFIYEDQQLLDMLVRHGQAAPAPAPAPAAPAGGPDPNQEKAAIRGLIDRLEQRLSAGPQGASEITAGTGQNVAFNSTHMKNLSQLVNFLGTNKIELNGKPIVVDGREDVQDPAYVNFTFEGDQAFRPSTTLQWKVNRNLLSQYLNTLKGQLVQNPNPVMEAQVDAMIRESNDQLDTKISDKYQDPGQTLDPAYVLDKVPQKMLTKTIIYAEGPIPLTFRDVSSDTAFNAWIQTNKIQVDNSPEPDQCGALKFLNARATSKLRNANSAQNKRVANIYQQALAKLAPSFQCDLGGGTSTKPGQDDKQQPGAGAGGGGDSPAVIMQLAQSLPLDLRDVDFTRIGNFLDMYERVISSNTDPRRASQVATVGTAIEQTRNYMQAAERMTANGNMTNFQMGGLTAGDLVEWSQPPTMPGQQTRSRGSAKALADYLDYVVRNTLSVVKNFELSYVNDLRGQQIFAQAPQLRNAVTGQTGVAFSNLNNIGTAKERLPQVGA
jgi:hypothetical protein